MEGKSDNRMLEDLCRILNEVKETGNLSIDEIDEEAQLYNGIIGLDSLDTATLSMKLEEKFGDDPYTEAQKTGASFPQSIGDILEFYEGDDR